MEARLQELKDSSSNIARFIKNAKRYSEIPEVTSEILRIFIKRAEVGERAEKYSRTAPQEVIATTATSVWLTSYSKNIKILIFLTDCFYLFTCNWK